ncbi:MAG: hypothetical protein ACOXZM_10320 [Eubacteriales bacterium]
MKKICRYQQYFATKEIIKTINETDERGNRQSGVIWHTQGSGKKSDNGYAGEVYSHGADRLPSPGSHCDRPKRT